MWRELYNVTKVLALSVVSSLIAAKIIEKMHKKPNFEQ